MAKYLVQANYSNEGTKGLLKDGGTGRRAAVEKLLESLGGHLEAFYYAFGETDLYVIAELPDNVSVTALSLTVAATGSFSKYSTTVLLAPEDIDAAAKLHPAYRAPGQ